MKLVEKLKNMPYLLLAVSICCEILSTTCMKLSNGFSEPIYVVLMLVGMAISFSLLTIILAKLPLGLTYGIWGGVGTVCTTIIGVVVWNDPFSALIAVGIVLVVAGIYFLNAGEKVSN